MKRVLATAIAILLSLPVFAADWSLVATKLRDSITYVQVGEAGACTGFVIDNMRDFVLTAAHCDVKGMELYVDLAPAKVRAKDVKNDLLILYVEGIDRPALKLAEKNPKIGEEVASYGYGYGLSKPFFRIAHISDDATKLPSLEGGPYFVIDANLIPGQSGGPIVNVKGEVVAIVQLTGDGVGFGTGAETIREKMGRYFVGGT